MTTQSTIPSQISELTMTLGSPKPTLIPLETSTQTWFHQMLMKQMTSTWSQFGREDRRSRKTQLGQIKWITGLGLTERRKLKNEKSVDNWVIRNKIL
jgi:hypothetical protein